MDQRLNNNYINTQRLALAATVMLLLVTTSTKKVTAQTTDTDGDTLSDQEELTVYHTDPAQTDTDSDGFIDGDEIKHGYSPLHKKQRLREVDTDKDGLWDDWEIAIGTNLTNGDTDGDSYADGEEIMHGYDPRSPFREKTAKRIEITLSSQTLRYYFGATKLDEFKISSGLPKTPTPIGEFTVIKKRPIVHYAGQGFDYPNTKWNLMFARGKIDKIPANYYIHGAWWHNGFGKQKSHGCVNVPYRYEYMGRLYDWADVGTPIVISK